MNLAAPRMDVLWVCMLASCNGIGEGSPDFPGGSELSDQPRTGSVTLRTVTDLDSGELLCSGCNACQVVTAAAGQRLQVEELRRSVRARDLSYQGGEGVAFGCAEVAGSNAIDPKVSAFSEALVPGLHCWRPPEDVGLPFLVTGMEVVPPEPDVKRPEPTDDSYVVGQGYRYRIEVRAPGRVFLEASGECARFDKRAPIVDLQCGSENPCDASSACMAAECADCAESRTEDCTFELPSFCHGGCAASACESVSDCPSPLTCVERRCTWKSPP